MPKLLLHQLPTELLNDIADYLDLEALYKLSLIEESKRLQSIVRDNLRWKQYIQPEYHQHDDLFTLFRDDPSAVQVRYLRFHTEGQQAYETLQQLKKTQDSFKRQAEASPVSACLILYHKELWESIVPEAQQGKFLHEIMCFSWPNAILYVLQDLALSSQWVQYIGALLHASVQSVAISEVIKKGNNIVANLFLTNDQYSHWITGLSSAWERSSCIKALIEVGGKTAADLFLTNDQYRSWITGLSADGAAHSRCIEALGGTTVAASLPTNDLYSVSFYHIPYRSSF